MSTLTDAQREQARTLKTGVNQPATSYHPGMRRADQISHFMGEDSPYEPYADISEEQMQCIAAYEAVHELLIQGGVEGGIQPVITFLHRYKHLSPSRNRMGREEMVRVLKEGPVQMQYSGLPYAKDEAASESQKAPWWQFWKRGQ